MDTHITPSALVVSYTSAGVDEPNVPQQGGGGMQRDNVLKILAEHQDEVLQQVMTPEVFYGMAHKRRLLPCGRAAGSP
jgi:hypothetical protein